MAAMAMINKNRTAEPGMSPARAAFCRGCSSTMSDMTDGTEKTSPDLSSCLSRAQLVMQQHTIAHSTTMIEIAVLESIVAEQAARLKGFCTILFCIFFFFIYASSTLLHLRVTDVFLMEEPLRQALTPSLNEVMEVGDVWDWMQHTFVPIFFRQLDMYGNALPQEEWSRVFMYSQLQGAVVLEQSRGLKGPCLFELAGQIGCHSFTKHSNVPFGAAFDSLPDDFNWSSVVTEADRDVGFVVDTELKGRRLRFAREEIQGW